MYKEPKIRDIDTGYEDISEDWSGVLTKMFKMVEELKVP